MEQRILFVCLANQCRSPTMALAFGAALADLGGPVWDVSSRGTHARSPRAMCTVAASVFEDDDALAARAREHRSQAITGEDIDAHALIIAASRAERASIARLRPDARGRVFTLPEALLLGSGRSLEASGPRRAASRAAAPLTSYAAFLDRHRGLLPKVDTRDRRRKAVHELDIPDAHHWKPSQHLSMLQDLRGTAAAFAQNLDAFVRT